MPDHERPLLVSPYPHATPDDVALLADCLERGPDRIGLGAGNKLYRALNEPEVLVAPRLGDLLLALEMRPRNGPATFAGLGPAKVIAAGLNNLAYCAGGKSSRSVSWA